MLHQNHQSQGYVEKAVLCRTPGYASMYRRPYLPNLSQDARVVLGEVGANTGWSAAAIAPVAATMLLPQIQTESQAFIANGWDSERCVCNLKIVHGTNESGTVKYVQYLTGYTNHMGMIKHPNGLIVVDPNMEVYFNNSLIYQETVYTNGMGISQVSIVPVDASQLVMGNAAASMYDPRDYSLRPADVYSTINSSILMETTNRYDNSRGTQPATANLYDSRVQFQQGTPFKKSSRSNLSPSNYLSKLLTTAADVALQNAGIPTDPGEVSTQIQSGLAEGYITSDQTLRAMLDRTGLAENRFVRWGELIQLYPNLESVVVKAGMDSAQVQGAVGMTGSADFAAASYSCVLAHTLYNTATSIMMEDMISTIHISGNNMSATNITTGINAGDFMLNTTYAESFIDGRPVELICEGFKSRLVAELLVGFTRHNHVPIAFNIAMSMFGESVVDISYNNEMMERYPFPAFADSAFTPILTANRTNLMTLASETRALNSSLLNQLI